jgi:ubiquinone/menaquinone biosynthesis C-methylase UbiE
MIQYGKLCSEFYDLDKPDARPDALECYLDYAKRSAGPILEPMCGTGRYLLPLLAQGLDIEGTDASSDMLALCQQRGKQLGLSPTLHCGRLEALELPRCFGLVFIPSGSFSLLTRERDAVQCLDRVFKALLPGGTFVVEVERAGFIEPSLSGAWEGRWLVRPDGAKLIQSWLQQYSGVEGIARSIHRYELVSDGKLVTTEFEDFEVKHYEPEAFASLLENAGFAEIRCLSPYERCPARDDDEGLLFECRKV